MTSIPLDEHAEEYRRSGRWLMDQAEWEFGQGDLIQASEKAWGAAAQFLKALAIQRGWRHGSHYLLKRTTDELTDETGNPEIESLFGIGERLHANFYEAFRTEGEVRADIDAMQRYIRILEALPPPDDLDEKFHDRTRTFHRTRVAEVS